MWISLSCFSTFFAFFRRAAHELNAQARKLIVAAVFALIVVSVGVTARFYYPNETVGGFSIAAWALQIGLFVVLYWFAQLVYRIVYGIFEFTTHWTPFNYKFYRVHIQPGARYFFWSVFILASWEWMKSNNPYPAKMASGENRKPRDLWWIENLLICHLILGIFRFCKSMFITDFSQKRKTERYERIIFNNILDAEIISTLTELIPIDLYYDVQSVTGINKHGAASIIQRWFRLRRKRVAFSEVDEMKIQRRLSGSKFQMSQLLSPSEKLVEEVSTPDIDLMLRFIGEKLTAFSHTSPLLITSSTVAENVGKAIFYHYRNSETKVSLGRIKNALARHPYLLSRFLQAFQKRYGVEETEIAESYFVQFVVAVFDSRQNLKRTLNDIDSIIDALSSFGNVSIAILMFITAMIVFGQSSLSSITVSLGTTLLAFSFVFGEALKNLFNSFLFLFVRQPFDIGDRVFLEVESSKPCYVQRMELLNTHFRQWDGKIITIPNHVLHGMKIFNIRRSGPQYDEMVLDIDSSTPIKKIEKFEQLFREFLRTHSDHFTEETSDFFISAFVNSNRLTMLFVIQHKSNWQFGQHMARRHMLYKFFLSTCEELAITYSFPPQPVVLKDGSGKEASAPSLMKVPSFVNLTTTVPHSVSTSQAQPTTVGSTTFNISSA